MRQVDYLKTSFQWHSQIQLEVVGKDRFLIACPEQNAIWVLDGQGNTLNQKSFEDTGHQIACVKVLANGGVFVYLMDPLSRSFWRRFDRDFKQVASGKFKGELTIHPFPMVSEDGSWFLSPDFAVYDPGLPERLVGQGIFTIQGKEIEIFSQHSEDGRLYSKMTLARLYELLKERTQGFFQPHALLNFDLENRVLIGNSHAGEVRRWDPKTRSIQDLFHWHPGESSEAQRGAVGRQILEDRILAKLPLDLGDDKEALLRRLLSEPDEDFPAPSCWGVFQLAEDVFGMVTEIDFASGDQVCQLFNGNGDAIGEISASHWRFLSPWLVPKIQVFDGMIYFVQPAGPSHHLEIVRSELQL